MLKSKKVKKFAEKVKKKSKGSDEMRRRYEEGQKRASGGGGGEGSEVYDELKEGKNYRRFLPRPGEETFYVVAPQHYRIGPNEKSVRCIGPAKCPVCKKFESEKTRINKKYPRGSEEGKKAYKKICEQFKPKDQFYANVVNTKTGDLRALRFGQQILQGLLEQFFDEELCGDFTDVTGETGRTMIIKRVGMDRSTEYTIHKTDETAEVEDWDEVQKSLHDLEKAAGALMTPEEITAILEGTEDEGSDDDEEEEESDDDADDDDDDEEEEEEEEEAPVKKKLKSKK